MISKISKFRDKRGCHRRLPLLFMILEIIIFGQLFYMLNHYTDYTLKNLILSSMIFLGAAIYSYTKYRKFVKRTEERCKELEREKQAFAKGK